MIWAAWACLTAALAAVSALLRMKPQLDASLAILGGLLAMQAAKLAFPDFMFLASTIIWVSCAGIIIAINGSKTPSVALSLVASGGCYFVGRVAGMTFKPNAALVAADVFGVVALLSIARAVSGGLARMVYTAYRNHSMGRNH